MVEFADGYRLATVVLVDTREEVAGKLPPVKLDQPWFQEIGQLVERVKQEFGLDITILRLLTTDTEHLPKIHVEYLAETTSDLSSAVLEPWNGELKDDPLRLPYARPGGPRRNIEWARARLAEQQLGDITAMKQLRTWNLSSIWRLKADTTTAWLKSIPPFFSHEGAAIDLLAGERVPSLIASDSERILMEDLPGVDCYDATIEQMKHMVDQLVDMQYRWSARTEELAKAGLPDVRSKALLETIPVAVARDADSLDHPDRELLEKFVEDLPGRFIELSACGIPDTLVHGDYHPGNWRGEGFELTILDWGDCIIGHPLLDMPPLLERAGTHRDELITHWIECWEARLPDSDPALAWQLIGPIAEVRQVILFQQFLDSIEPSERVYHASDPVRCLAATAKALKEEFLGQKWKKSEEKP